MDFKEYQQLAQRTANYERMPSQRMAVAGLGLCGEAGEVVEKIKKFLGHGHELIIDDIENELGDVLWYVAEICAILNLDMEQVAIKNIEKLKKRFPNGFSTEDSIKRVDVYEKQNR